MIWIAGIIIVCLGVCLPLYMHYKASLNIPMACAYKSLGTLCAFLASMVAAIRLDSQCWFCAIAILFYAVADTFLELNFILGMGIFIAGHIVNAAFFMRFAPVSAFHLIGFLLLATITAYSFWHARKQIGKHMTALVIYAISLAIMCVSAIACFLTNTLAGILISCGGTLFFISDFFLFHSLLHPAGKLSGWIIMITYYVSVLLFGIACLQF